MSFLSYREMIQFANSTTQGSVAVVRREVIPTVWEAYPGSISCSSASMVTVDAQGNPAMTVQRII